MISPRKILLIQLGDVGDVVLTAPTIRAVKETYPGAQVSILVKKPFGGVLSADPNLDSIIEFSKERGSLLHVIRAYWSFIAQLRKPRYDLVIDVRTGDRGAIFSLLTGAAQRVGRYVGNKYWRNSLFTTVLHDYPPGPSTAHPGADQSLRIVRAIGIDTTNSLPKLYAANADRNAAVALLAECSLTPEGRWVTINPFSRWQYKEWNNGKWGEVIDWLWERYQLPSILVGSPGEIAGAEAIAEGRRGHTFVLTGKTTLGELAALISMSSLHLGVDSAAPHMAAAFAVPSVTLHGPSDWRSWRMADELHRIVRPPLDCVPCRRMGCDDSQRSRCLEELDTSAVIAAVEEVLHSNIMK